MGLTTTGLRSAPPIHLSGILVVFMLATSCGVIDAALSAASTNFDSLSEASKAAVISLLNEAADESDTDPLNLIRLGLEKANENKERLARQDSPNIADFLPQEEVPEHAGQESLERPMPERLSFDDLDGDGVEPSAPGQQSSQQDSYEARPVIQETGAPEGVRDNEPPPDGTQHAVDLEEPQVGSVPNSSNSRGFDEDLGDPLDGYAQLETTPSSNEPIWRSSAASASASGGGAASSSAASGGDGGVASASASSSSGGSSAASAEASSASLAPVGDVDGDGDVDHDDAVAAAANATPVPPQIDHVQQADPGELQVAQHDSAAMPESRTPSETVSPSKKKRKKRKKKRHHVDVYKDSYVDRTYPNDPQLVRIKSKKRIGPNGVTEEHVETRTSVSGNPNSYGRSSTSYSSSSSSRSSGSPFNRNHHHRHGYWNGGAPVLTPRMHAMPPMLHMPQMLPMPAIAQMPPMAPMTPMAPFGFNMNPMGNYWMQQPGATTSFASSVGGVPTTYTSGDGYATSFASAGDNLSYDIDWNNGDEYGHSRKKKRSGGRY